MIIHYETAFFNIIFKEFIPKLLTISQNKSIIILLKSVDGTDCLRIFKRLCVWCEHKLSLQVLPLSFTENRDGSLRYRR